MHQRTAVCTTYVDPSRQRDELLLVWHRWPVVKAHRYEAIQVCTRIELFPWVEAHDMLEVALQVDAVYAPTLPQRVINWRDQPRIKPGVALACNALDVVRFEVGEQLLCVHGLTRLPLLRDGHWVGQRSSRMKP